MTMYKKCECGSMEEAWEMIQLPDDTIRVEYECLECGKAWVDTYSLTDSSSTKE